MEKFLKAFGLHFPISVETCANDKNDSLLPNGCGNKSSEKNL
jgi:hypothetical protein